MAPSLWLDTRIAAAAADLMPGFQVEVVEHIDSTNTELMRRARTGQLTPVLLAAQHQTAGRGRLGRPWQSAQEGQVPASLTFSLGFQLAPRDWSGLSLVIGVSVAESLDPEQTARVALKWPNDLWVGDRKLGGILIETASPPAGQSEAGRSVVIGIGINIGPRDATGLSTPPAWLQQWQPDATPQRVLPTLVVPLLRDVLAFAAHGFAPFVERFARRDVLRGRDVQLSDGTAGFCEGVGPGGELRVRTAEGLREITSSEVSVRPQGMTV